MTDKRLQMARDNREADYQCGQHDGALAERAAIVAWLREEGHRAFAESIPAKGDDGLCLWAYGDARIRAADRIERGDHITHKER